MPDVIIVGAGIAGLAAAYELNRRGVSVLVLERSARPGGVILNETVDGFIIDAGPDSLLIQKPDGITLDLHLPDLPGEVFLHTLQGDPRIRAIPVVVLSADATPGQMQRLLAAGARAYLTKPLDMRSFFQLVDEALQERRLDHTG